MKQISSSLGLTAFLGQSNLFRFHMTQGPNLKFAQFAQSSRASGLLGLRILLRCRPAVFANNQRNSVGENACA
jgi:hypothetical protein